MPVFRWQWYHRQLPHQFVLTQPLRRSFGCRPNKARLVHHKPGMDRNPFDIKIKIKLVKFFNALADLIKFRVALITGIAEMFKNSLGELTIANQSRIW